MDSMRQRIRDVLRAPKYIGAKLLAGTLWNVEVRNEKVVLSIAGTNFEITNYDDAINIGVCIFKAGKLAKLRAGDTSRRLIGFADLTDANMDVVMEQHLRDSTAAFTNRK